MPNEKNPFSDSPVKDAADTVAGRTAARAGQAKDSLSDMARTATTTIDQSRETAADRLDAAASTVLGKADQLPGGAKVQDFARAAADRLETTAEYVRSHDTARMMADVERLVKNNPGPALAVAAAFGFIVGRAISRD